MECDIKWIYHLKWNLKWKSNCNQRQSTVQPRTWHSRWKQLLTFIRTKWACKLSQTHCPSTLSRFGSCSSQQGSMSRTRQNSSSRRSVLLEARRVILLLSPPRCLPCDCPVPRWPLICRMRNACTSRRTLKRRISVPGQSGSDTSELWLRWGRIPAKKTSGSVWWLFGDTSSRRCPACSLHISWRRAGEMSSPRNCGSTAERTARVLLGVLWCWRITISVKLER